MSFQFLYDRRFAVFQSVNLSEVAEVIDSDHVVFACAVSFTGGDEAIYVPGHAWLKETFTGCL